MLFKMSSVICFNLVQSKILPFGKRQILDLFELKEVADDNNRKFSKLVENTVGKGEIARKEQFLLFPQCFKRTSTADT